MPNLTWPPSLARHLTSAPSWSPEPELLDGDTFSDDDLAGNLADLRRINRLLGGAWLTLRGVERLISGTDVRKRWRTLDVATGGADIPRALQSWALRRGLDVEIVVSDLSPRVLQAAGSPSRAGLEFVLADARSLPFPDRSIDLVTSSLALHHFPPLVAVEALSEMRRVARHGVVVNDLLRSWHGYGGAWLMTHSIVRNRLTRVDAPRSVLRAYTRPEFVALMHAAGFERLAVDSLLGYRMAVTGWCDS